MLKRRSGAPAGSGPGGRPRNEEKNLIPATAEAKQNRPAVPGGFFIRAPCCSLFAAAEAARPPTGAARRGGFGGWLGRRRFRRCCRLRRRGGLGLGFTHRRSCR